MDMPAPVNPDDPGRGIWFMGLTWTLSILSLLAVAVRFWVRLTVTMIMYAEDWIMLFACVRKSPTKPFPACSNMQTL
jgi:hypothetical protein